MHSKESSVQKSSVQLYFDNLVKTKKKIEFKNIDGKNYKHLVICFTTYYHRKSIKLLNLHYHKFIGKIE